ncbi:MAG: GAF domain-containing protein [Myxococcaceae bacterium]|jgi:class 3 adenylate cyclase/putative methionine-R-sulfoxide reductase with GAF domain|nr:GAF domain-containing protein [Myxococcaceae bacterium]
MSDEADALRTRLAQLEARAASLDIITALAASLTHAADIDDVLWDVANGTVARLGLEDCVIYLVDESAGCLVQRAAYGPKNPRGREILAPITIPLGKGIVGSVAASGIGERLDDVREDGRYITDDQPRLSELAVPMFFRERVIGVIDSEHSQRAFFTEEHERLFTAIAAITSSRIGRAFMDEQLRDAQRLTAGIIEAAQDAILTLDARGRVVSFNRSAREVFRREPDDVLLEPVGRLLPGWDVEAPLPAGLVVLDGLRHDGSVFPAEIASSRVQTRKKPLTTLVVRDISERLRVERELSQLNQHLEARISERTRELSEANRKNEALLLNVLPAPVAERLKAGESTIAERFDEVSVLFADLAGFTRMASGLPPERVVDVLRRIFTSFDALSDRHGLEKIKTIGDAYMVVAGLPEPVTDHRERAASMALDMLAAIRGLGDELGQPLALRIGLHAGPVVAGVIGTRKFAYDLWGDTVNTASRLESQGQPGEIHVADSFKRALDERFRFEPRGTIELRGVGPLVTWFLRGR